MPLVSTKDLGVTNGVKVLVYGASGSGKTRLTATAPSPLIVAAEKGLLSLRQFNLPAWEISSLAELTQVYDWVTKSAEGKQFQTICIDSISEVGEKVLVNAKAGARDPRQAYGVLLDQMTDIIKAFRDLPGKNVYMIAKQEPVKDELTGILKWGPSMPGSKLSVQLPYLFDEVFHLGKVQTPNGEVSALRTSENLQYLAKDRSGALAEFEHPDLNSIFSKILGV